MTLQGRARYGSGDKGKSLIFLWNELWGEDKFPYELKEELAIAVHNDMVIIDKAGAVITTPDGKILPTKPGKLQSYERYVRQVYVSWELAKEGFPFEPNSPLWVRIEGTRSYITRLDEKPDDSE